MKKLLSIALLCATSTTLFCMHPQERKQKHQELANMMKVLKWCTDFNSKFANQDTTGWRTPRPSEFTDSDFIDGSCHIYPSKKYRELCSNAAAIAHRRAKELNQED